MILFNGHSRSRSRLRGRCLTLMFLALTPGAVVAQERPGFTIGTDADARVTIRNSSGSIRVTAWDRNEVSVYGGRAVIRDLDIDATPKHVQLRMETGHELNVRVPRRAQLRAYSGSGSVTV